MEHAHPIPAPFPWRAATVVAAGVALLELVALVALLLIHLAPKTTASPVVRRPVAKAPAVHHVAVRRVPQVPLRPRSKVRVLVLNGNGVNGAASSEAARLQGDGYRVMGAVDAQRHDYARSMVLYVPGWIKEARRLARETGVRVVTPVDGLRGAQLKGSSVILLLGN